MVGYFIFILKSKYIYICEWLDLLKSPIYYTVKDAKSLKSVCHEVELDTQNLDPWNKRKGRDSDSDSSDDPDPALTVVPRSSKSMSGVCRHKDFIRSLPVDIAKIILGKSSFPKFFHLSMKSLTV